MGIYIENISENVCEFVNNTIDNYFDNFYDILGVNMNLENDLSARHIYSRLKYKNDGNNLLSFNYSNHYDLNGVLIGYHFNVKDDWASFTYSKSLPDNTVKETAIDLNINNNKVVMYTLNTTRNNVDRGKTLTFDDMELLPSICDDYSIDVFDFMVNNDSLLTGISKVNKKSKTKVKK
ncbi:MAG: hypothetical protein IJL76_01260 [Bacilli bacterium]|nr:hypothetical protein [Bacilli bacterium]